MVHLELTSRCNASCPMCARNIQGGKVNPLLPQTDLSLEDIKSIFPESFVSQLRKIYLCGNYGDPVAAKDTLEVLEYFKTINPTLNLGIHTNGGARDSKWWARIAKTVSYCRFGIDGLQDTNHLYRQGVRWEKLIENVRAFIDAGGRAEWDYLLFRHNEHQIEDARKLSKELGFQLFQVKNTSRFFDSKSGKTAKGYQVLNSLGEPSHQLYPSLLPEYQNKALETDYHEVVRDFGSVENYWDQTEIDCRVGLEKSIYISAEGLVFPCCWTANQTYSIKNPRQSSVWKILETLPEKEKSISAFHKPLSEIIEGRFFQVDLPNSWSRPSVRDGKLQVCAKTCGKCVKPFESQFIK
jgi:MoaA/NifB/PqqE/SkfB family radical SAM enzyme